MMTKKVFLICSVFILSTFLSLGKEFSSSLKVYDSVISPVLEAKCVSCHGAEKDKGKLRMHNKEALIKGGRGAGEDIIIKGDPNGSEIIFRITLQLTHLASSTGKIIESYTFKEDNSLPKDRKVLIR